MHLAGEAREFVCAVGSLPPQAWGETENTELAVFTRKHGEAFGVYARTKG